VRLARQAQDQLDLGARGAQDRALRREAAEARLVAEEAFEADLVADYLGGTELALEEGVDVQARR
jgi:hypothetical protein